MVPRTNPARLLRRSVSRGRVSNQCRSCSRLVFRCVVAAPVRVALAPSIARPVIRFQIMDRPLVFSGAALALNAKRHVYRMLGRGKCTLPGGMIEHFAGEYRSGRRLDPIGPIRPRR